MASEREDCVKSKLPTVTTNQTHFWDCMLIQTFQESLKQPTDLVYGIQGILYGILYLLPISYLVPGFCYVGHDPWKAVFFEGFQVLHAASYVSPSQFLCYILAIGSARDEWC